ncbi:fe(2+) transport protein 1-like isoform X2 [Wolffia australiana]
MGKRSFFDAIILIFAMAISLAASQEAQEASKCDPEHLRGCYDKKEAMKLKGIAIGVILVASMAGVSLPLFSRLVPVFGPEKNLFAVVKAFASGVILATGFMHVLPDSLSNLESDCLPTSPWHEFPFSTFIAMVCAVGTLMMDSFSMAFHRRTQQKTVDVVVQRGVTPPTLPTHIPAHGHEHFLTVLPSSRTTDEASDTTLNRNRVIAQVLEMGIVVHSVVIGLCMGASQSPCAIKPLVAALSFHQFFEGMGLGGCIFQCYGTDCHRSSKCLFCRTAYLHGACGSLGSRLHGAKASGKRQAPRLGISGRSAWAGSYVIHVEVGIVLELTVRRNMRLIQSTYM